VTGTVLIAVAAWLRPGTVAARPQKGGLVVPAISSVAITLAIVALVWDHFSRLSSLTILLATLTLVAACAQLALLYRAHTTATARALRAESIRSASTRAALDCVISMDAEGVVREWNEAASRTFGYGAADVIGRSLAELIIPPALRAQHSESLAQFSATGESRILNRRIELTAMRAGGGEFPIELAVTQVDEDPPIFTGFIRDISDRKAREAENERLAAIVRSSEDAIVSRDLDGAVTAWNHGAEVLYGFSAEEAIGSKLESLTVPAERSEELGTVMELLTTGKVAALETERLRKDGELMTVSLRSFAVRDLAGAMVGISAISHDITDRRRREAEERSDHEAALWRSRIESALAEDRLLFYGQPVIDLRTGFVDHTELLLRMELDGEIIAPGAFLPHAEQTTLIRRIDRWAVDRGIELARSMPVAINLSAKSLDDTELGERIARALVDHTLAENVTFELTETAAASNIDDAQRLVAKLASLGCGVSLDDFGTGYSSFTYLKHLAVTELKIDIEFIRGLVDDPADRHVVRSMVSVAKSFGVKTVAEGVEDEPTLELLRELGVDMIQGYHLGRPGPIAPAVDPPALIVAARSRAPRSYAEIERVAS
jgi:PAS domain S-box-containing protein